MIRECACGNHEVAIADEISLGAEQLPESPVLARRFQVEWGDSKRSNELLDDARLLFGVCAVLGSEEQLREIASTVKRPCLRKDFTVDAYMIYEAKALGAAAVLLIVSILDEKQLMDYLALCRELGLSALVEAHKEAEIETALRAGAEIIGVNNRNLHDFTVDTDNSRRLRRLIPPGILFVSESGVKNAEDVQRMREIGADAVLVGETLMRAEDKAAKLRELRGET